MSDSVKWQDLPANAQTDAALRAAAAERVMGWQLRAWGTKFRWLTRCEEYVMMDHNWLGGCYMIGAMNDVRRVFREGRRKQSRKQRETAGLRKAWEAALDDERRGLCLLLDHLNIPVPEGLVQ